MPFSPLPATFIDDLQRLAPGGVLELGCGDGGLTALLHARGVQPLTLDRAGPLTGARPHVRGDALDPPLRRRFSLVVAANLVRHLWPRIRASGPAAWRDLVAPGGALWILEDEPRDRPPAVRNYRDLQAFLARVVPGSRRPLLPLTAFQNSLAGWSWGGRWRTDTLANSWPADPEAVLAWLAGGESAAGDEAARLVAAIRRDGLDYGQCWWARWSDEDVR